MIERVQKQADRSIKENRCENKLKYSVKIKVSFLITCVHSCLPVVLTRVLEFEVEALSLFFSEGLPLI